MPNYRYFATYPRFFPGIRDGNGKSLEAVTGMVVAWDSPPSTAEWAETADPVTWPVGETPPPAPEVPQEPFPNEPEPEAPVAVPEVPEEPAGAPEPEPVPEPDPEPEPEPEPEEAPEPPQAVRDWFASIGQTPPSRA